MSERDYAPLSIACVRGLCDKIYEKRKFAGGEIEKMVKDFSDANNTSQIKRLIRVLGQDLMSSTNPNVKNGALMGLSSVAVGLGKGCVEHMSDLIHPIIACFSESESRVRYQAVEALFNVVKIARGESLAHFPLIFDALARLAADSEPQVKQAAELLDRLVKDIVTESPEFEVSEFVGMVRERLYTRSAFARQFAVSWVAVLDAVPGLDLLPHLPDLLDGLFKMLDDPVPEIRRMCDVQLSEFLRCIKKEPSRVDFQAMINILITHAMSTEELMQLTAATWLKEFVELAGAAMLPHASGVLAAVLPCLAYADEPRKSIRETAATVNLQLTKLVLEQPPLTETSEGSRGDPGKGASSDSGKEASSDPGKGASSDSGKEASGDPGKGASSDSGKEASGDPGKGASSDSGKEASGDPGKGASSDPAEGPPAGEGDRLNLDAVVGVLTQMLHRSSVHTKVAALDWILHLYNKLPNEMYVETDSVFVSVVGSLTDPSDDVVRRALAVLAEICSCAPPHPRVESGDELESNPYYYKFLQALLRLLAADDNLLEDRGAFIIRQLCVLLNAEHLFVALSRLAAREAPAGAARALVDVLAGLLLTAAELCDLRLRLRAFRSPATHALFSALYPCWCRSPVALLALCLLTHNYRHCNRLVATFGDLEITVDFLTEVDKLVQLIESPIFAYLRLELLGGEQSAELRGALYGVLMLLPQSDAFHALRRRLQCAPASPALLPSGRPEGPAPDIDFEALLDEFKRVQRAHRQHRALGRAGRLLD